MGQVFGVGHERFPTSQIQFIVFQIGRALHQASTASGNKGQNQGKRGHRRPEFEGRACSFHVPWFKVRHSVVLRDSKEYVHLYRTNHTKNGQQAHFT